MSIKINKSWLSEQTDEVQNVIGMLLEHIKKQDERIAQLEKRNAELEKRLGITPQNSSLPPSTQHPHAKPPSNKPKSKRKQGGQKGHKKHQRELVPIEQVDAIVPCIPESCRRCGCRLSGHDDEPIRHQVFELPEIKPHITEYQQHRLGCSKCGITTCGALPQGVPTHSAGPRLTAFVSLLMAHYRQSKRRTALFLESILNIPASPGWICKLQNQTTQALRVAYERLLGQLPRQTRLGIDETPMKQAGRNTWLWSFVAEKFSVFKIRPSRSGTILDDVLTDRFDGIVTCDRAKMYWRLPSLQWCWAHLKRDFRKMADRSIDSVQELGEGFLEQTRILFRQVARCRDGTISRKGLKISLGKTRKKVEALLLRGLECDHARTAGTCQELYWYRDRLWRFLDHPDVEPTNNASERSLRHAVIWRKLSFGSQSEKGSRFVETMLTVIETCRQQNRHVFEYLSDSLTKTFANQPPPSLLPRV